MFGLGKIKNGVAGTAQVQAASVAPWDASMANGSMWLDVYVEGWPPYRVKKSFMVSTKKWPQPGQTLPVTVDPKNHEKLHVEWDQVQTVDQQMAQGAPAPFPGAPGAVMGSDGTTAPIASQTVSAAQLLATGSPGHAVVVQSQPLGQNTPDGDPIYLFVLDVTADSGGAPFNATIGHRVPKTDVSFAAVGTQLKVAFDPAMPTQKVAIDWPGSSAPS